jgi:hypothetical protein
MAIWQDQYPGGTEVEVLTLDGDWIAGSVEEDYIPAPATLVPVDDGGDEPFLVGEREKIRKPGA